MGRRWVVLALLLAVRAWCADGEQPLERARRYDREYTWDKAAEAYEEFARRFPDDAKAPSAGLRALELRYRYVRPETVDERLQAYLSRWKGTLWSARARALHSSLGRGEVEEQLVAVTEFEAGMGPTPSLALREEWARLCLAAAAGCSVQVAVDELQLPDTEEGKLSAARLASARELCERVYQRAPSRGLAAEALWQRYWIEHAHNTDTSAATSLLLRLVRDYADTRLAADAWKSLALDAARARPADFLLARARALECIQRYPTSSAAEAMQWELKRWESPTLGVDSGTEVLPGQRFVLRARTRNVRHLSIAARRFDPLDAESYFSRQLLLLRRPHSERGSQRFEDVLASRPADVAWAADVADKGDMQSVVTQVEGPVLGRGFWQVSVFGGSTATHETFSVNVSTLSLTGVSDGAHGVMLLVDRAAGRPVSGAAAVGYGAGLGDELRQRWAAKTDADGLLHAPAETMSWRSMVVARRGEDVAVAGGGPDLYALGLRRDEFKVYVTTDRPVYRPGDTVRFKAILRRVHDGRAVNLPQARCSVMLLGGRDDLPSQELRTDDFGAVSGEWALSAGAALGEYRAIVQCQANDPARGGPMVQVVGDGDLFRVEAYRKPEFRVEVAQPEAVPRWNQPLRLPVRATYLNGSPVVGATVALRVSDDWADWQPPWSDEDAETPDVPYWRRPRGDWQSGQDESTPVEGPVVKTDGTGRAVLEWTPRSDREGLDDTVFGFSVAVTDVQRRTEAGSASVTVTADAFRLGLRAERQVGSHGQPIRLALAARDNRDRPAAAKALANIYRLEYQPFDPMAVPGRGEGYASLTEEEGPWRRGATVRTVPVDVRAEAAPTRLLLDDLPPGHYEVVVSADNPWATRHHREPITATTRVWVTAADGKGPEYAYQGLAVVAERRSVPAGERARLLVNTPAADGWLLLTVAGSELIENRVIHLTSRSTLLDLAVPAGWAPNVTLAANYIGPNGVAELDPEAGRFGLQLAVPTPSQRLTVQVSADKAVYGTGEKGRYQIRALGSDGKPVSAQVCLGLADAAVYALSEDPAEPIGDVFLHLRRRAMLEPFGGWALGWPSFGIAGREKGRGSSPDAVAGPGMAAPPAGAASVDAPKAAAPGAIMSLSNGGPTPAAVATARARDFFPDTLLWQPAIQTDANGEATVDVTFPDSLTTWRATARAITADTRCGETRMEVMTNQPLVARIAAPRFLVAGDSGTLGVMLDNATDAQAQVAVSLAAEGVEVEGARTASVTVLPHAQARADFALRAVAAGPVTLTASARGATASDQVLARFEVLPHTAPGFAAASGRINAAIGTAWLKLPTIVPGSARLTVRACPSLALSLADALPYLVQYPYGCAEQVADKLLAAAMVARALKYLPAAPSPSTAPAQVPEWWRGLGLPALPKVTDEALARLGALARGDGFAWFPEGEADPYITAHVAAVLVQARLAGVEVPETLLRQSCVSLLARLDGWSEDDAPLAALACWALSEAAAYNLPVGLSAARRARLDAALDKVYERRERLNDYTRSLLALALMNRGQRDRAEVLWRNIQVRRDESATAVCWGKYRWADAWSEDRVETTAFALLAGLRVEPSSPLVDKAATWLLENRQGTRWYGTKDTALAIYALIRYAAARGETRANQTATLSVNGTQVAGWEVTPATIASAQQIIAVDPKLLRAGDNRLEFRRDGAGPIYWSAVLDYQETADRFEGVSHKLGVRRTYRVTRSDGPTELHDGDRVAVGDVVEVEIQVTLPNALSYLLVTDPKPAGFEPVERLSEHHWAGYREFREREVAFCVDHATSKSLVFRYNLRAEAPGTWHALPTQVQAFYRPDVRGRGDEGVLSVVDAAR